MSILTQRTQGKTPPPRRGKELLGRRISDPSLESARRDYCLVGPIAARTSPLHSVTLRATITSLKKSYSITSFPIDNPHRGSGDWLGHGFISFYPSSRLLFGRQLSDSCWPA